MYAIVCVDPRLYFTPHSRSFPYTCKLLACTIGSSLQLKSSCLSPKHIVFSVYMKNNMHLTNPVSCVGNPFAYRKLFYFENILFLIKFDFSSWKSAFHTPSTIFDSSLIGLITKKKKNGCFSVFPVFYFSQFFLTKNRNPSHTTLREHP